MNVVLTHEETQEAMAFYLQEKYNIGGNASVDIVKQPKTGNITTTVTFTPNTDKAMAGAQERTTAPTVDDDTAAAPESDEPADDAGTTEADSDGTVADLFGKG